MAAEGPILYEPLKRIPFRDVAVFDVLEDFADVGHRVSELGDQCLAFFMSVPEPFAEAAHGEFGHRVLQHTERPECGRETRLMRPVVQVRQQERLREQREFDHAAHDVLAKAIDDAQAKTLLTEELKRDRLQPRPLITSSEVSNGGLENGNCSRCPINEEGPRTIRAALPWRPGPSVVDAYRPRSRRRGSAGCSVIDR
jgi:hypothetical protein